MLFTSFHFQLFKFSSCKLIPSDISFSNSFSNPPQSVLLFGVSTYYGPLIALLAPRSGLCCLGWWRTCCRQPSESVPSFGKQLLICSPHSLHYSSPFFSPHSYCHLRHSPLKSKWRVWLLIKESVRVYLSLLYLMKVFIFQGAELVATSQRIQNNIHESLRKATAAEKVHLVYRLF